ncbi:hypothetical protein JQ607_33960 [Bradyrhizobium liaoningense]|uniref:hypothetical protein n=1 Tax=Bradyrhizobium liaoningense TaxID=43992 RepID=UPI001BAC7809|nr:hypothetical protein [Bradyrhizobium liaoningense]MBR0845220.1 hypothetical protein [Bradyrhizobium liaoningense]
MNSKTTIATAFVLALTTPAHALNNGKDQKLIKTIVASIIVGANCSDDYEPAEGGLMRYGDTIGVSDTLRLLDATREWFALKRGDQYDRSKLIPEVSDAVNRTLGDYLELYKTHGKKLCDALGPSLVQSGVLRQRSTR